MLRVEGKFIDREHFVQQCPSLKVAAEHDKNVEPNNPIFQRTAEPPSQEDDYQLERVPGLEFRAWGLGLGFGV